MKQTAVEWLEDEINKVLSHAPGKSLNNWRICCALFR